MIKYRFFITDTEKARNEFRTWAGRANINIKNVLDAGYIDLYSNRPDYVAGTIGSTKWELITK